MLRRVDRKYVITDDVLTSALRRVEQDLEVLTFDGHREQRYDTTYFDSPDLLIFHESRASRPQRSKVRLRRYLETGEAMLEVKRRSRHGLTIKARQPWKQFDSEAHRFVRQHMITTFVQPSEIDGLIERLSPTSRTWYTRVAMQHADGARVTVDRNLLVGSARLATHHLPNRLIVETKALGPATEFDRLLWSLGARPASISKYALSIAACYPSQPTNRWSRYANELRSAAAVPL